jgi:hypothetical protein
MSSSLYLQRQASNMRGSIQSLQTQIRPIIEKPVSAGFAVRGTKTLFMVIALREYDEDGDLVAIGSESSPLATGHTLEPTWDWTRAHE